MKILSDNHITNKERNWSLEYAEAEWEWYLSGDPSIDKLGQNCMVRYHRYGKSMADSNRNVNSNYGYQWQRKQSNRLCMC